MLIGNLLPLKDNFFEIFNVQPDRAVKTLRFFRNFLLMTKKPTCTSCTTKI